MKTEHVLQAIEPQLTKRIKLIQRSIDLDLSKDEKSIFTLLEHNPIHIDELCIQLKKHTRKCFLFY